MLTVWKSGQIDLSAFRLRKALIELDEYNCNTDVVLQGKESYLIKKLLETIT